MLGLTSLGLGLSGSNGFSPTSIADLIGWYDAGDFSQVAYQTGSRIGEGTVSAVANKVAGLTALTTYAGLGFGTDYPKHLYGLNGKPAFTNRDGATATLLLPDSGTYISGRTYITASALRVDGAFTFLLGGSGSAGVMYINTSGQMYYSDREGAGDLLIASGFDVDSDVIVVTIVITSDASMSIYVNDSAAVTLDPKDVGLGTNFKPFGNYNGGTGTGASELHEALVYDRAITAEEVALVNPYLASKWAPSTVLIGVVMAGQSNSTGYQAQAGAIAYQNDKRGRVYQLNDTLAQYVYNVDVATPAGSNYTVFSDGSAGWSMGGPTINYLADRIGGQIVMIPCNKGGLDLTGPSEWGLRTTDFDITNPFGATNERMRLAKAAGVNIIAVQWQQGEQDATDPTVTVSEYQTALNTLIDDIRSVNADSDLIWSLGVISDDLLVGSYPNKDEVQEALRTFTKDDTRLADTAAFTTFDNIHFNAAGLEDGGYLHAQRIYNAYLSQLTTNFYARFPLAAALYSLRDLNDADSAAVRVRRSSDDAEQDFTPAEINDGTLVDFVVPTDVQALYNNSMYFDGVDNDVVTDINHDMSTDLTWSIDFLYRVGVTGQVLSNRDPSTPTQYIRLTAISDGRIFIGAVGAGSSESSQLVAAGVLTDNTVYNVVLNWDATATTWSATIGDEPTVTTASCGAISNSGVFRFGSDRSTTSYFNGFIKEANYQSGATVWDGTSDGATSKGWTVNGSPALFTGQGFNGLVSTLYDQRVSTADDVMYFDGVVDYVDLNESIFNTDGSDFEVEIDIIIPSSYTTTTFAGYFLSQWSGGDNTSIGIGGTAAGVNANKLAFVGGTSNVMYGPVINDDLPHTIKVTLISGEYTVYVDNVSIGSITKTNNPPAISTEVGTSTNTTNRFVEGVFYNIRKDGVVLYNGDGNLDENWTGQNGATDGTVNGSPSRVNPSFPTIISNDATQTTAANQPFIVENGALVTTNGLPAIYSGEDEPLSGGEMATQVKDGVTIVTVFSAEASVSLKGGVFVSIDNNTDFNSRLILARDTNSNNLRVYHTDNSGTTYTLSLVDFFVTYDNENVLVTIISSASGIDLRVNGVLTSPVASGTFNNDCQGSFIGLNGYSHTTTDQINELAEVLVYGPDQSASLTEIEANINDYYGIY